MKKIGLLAVLTALALMLAFSAAALGDDVDFGAGDWSSDNNDSGGNWVGGNNDSGGNWGGGGGINYGGGYTAANMGVLSMGGGTILVIIIIAVAFYVMSRKNANTSSGVGSVKRVDAASLRVLLEKDPKFSAADIEAKVKNWVLQFEDAWCRGDMTSCRPFLSDGLYNTYQMQLDMMRRNGEAPRTEDLAVMACGVERWSCDRDKEYLDVWLYEKKKTYKVDINNPQKVIKGDRRTTYLLQYRWQLMRSAGSLTENAGIRVQECPNCGAQTSVNQSGKCEYCGSTLKSESFDWILNKVDKLTQTSRK